MKLVFQIAAGIVMAPVLAVAAIVGAVMVFANPSGAALLGGLIFAAYMVAKRMRR